MHLEQFKNKHVGESCAILGGGVSLPNDLRSMGEVDRLIGVNQHAAILDLDYLVFLDTHVFPLVKDIKNVLLITKKKKHQAPNLIHAGIAPPIGYSGLMAIWIADYMGFDKIAVCGMDQYDTRKEPREYWWEGPQCQQMQRHKLCNADLYFLKKYIDENLQHPQRVHFVSGRLKEIHK